MEIVRKEKKLCLCCMEEHEVSIVKINEDNIYKGEALSYEASYEYCENADEMIASEEMISANDIEMKNAYRSKMGLLTTNDICAIRQKYGISQSDLAILLGWGEKTITRYESHQVQDMAHNAILQKINQDPEWYMDLLEKAKDRFSESAFEKYMSKAKEIYESYQDNYLRKTIQSQYVKYEDNAECSGNLRLNLDKVIDAVNYFANSVKVKWLYKVKLMKLLWYSDALSYKRYGHSITGLIYKAFPMGAVPLQYDLIIDLNGICYEEVEFDEGSGYHFVSNSNNLYSTLSDEDKSVLETVINAFGDKTKDCIVNTMHQEKAYIETAPSDIIQYKYSMDLSLN